MASIEEQVAKLSSDQKHLRMENEKLRHRLGIQEDIAAIRRLQFTYGYYIDKCLYKQVVDLFHPTEGAVRFHGSLWKGKEGVRRLYVGRFSGNFTAGRNGPIKGFLLDHLQLQDIVTVAPDRLSAKMRSRAIMQAGKHHSEPLTGGVLDMVPEQWWEGGIYENQYVRDSVDSPWMFKLLNYQDFWQSTFERGWAKEPHHLMAEFTKKYPEDPFGPDVITPATATWPETHVIPFHYNHPITGEPVSEEEMHAPTITEYKASKQA